MIVPWLFPFRNRGTSKSSNSKVDRAGSRKHRRGADRSKPPLFELTALEQRLFLSFAPSISGAASTLGGQSYVLNLHSTGSTPPTSWSINWGDGSDPVATALSANNSRATLQRALTPSRTPPRLVPSPPPPRTPRTRPWPPSRWGWTRPSLGKATVPAQAQAKS